MDEKVIEAATPAPLHEEEHHIFNECVELSLSQDSILTRRLIRSDGASFSQIVAIDRMDDLSDFATADPYQTRLEGSYDRIRQKCVAAMGSERMKEVKTGDPVRLIGEISMCATEGALLSKVRTIIASLGGMQFTYQWIRFNGANPSTGDSVESRYLVGCRPAWTQQYIARLWYMNDPYVTYARKNVAPALASHVNVHRTDHWLVTEARMHGFASGIVAPAHIHGHGLVGLLHVSNSIRAPDGEGVLWDNRVLFRAISSELLDWRVSQVRQNALVKYELSEQETEILRMLRDGASASHVADQLGMSKHTVYKTIYQRITRKTGATRITDAVEKAAAHGLLD
ncbi:DNA-binding CsgD family transcriptional regulator [Paraburkholderia sp. BL27I4N3]|uniref:helix-turn-helix transcriptional regulator n=1 Tax=Paraburkholderia sp. BL27I4N3 TaxID=1938805 RepID=UPI000E271A8A|nr:LuxR family transcriptional regulator [Paraburkholderia sp. BL27I4N3]REE06542.1 DNA-binding CsgD family transcriptional regulator [Paraburkholderia sp. BL27I4N3]